MPFPCQQSERDFFAVAASDGQMEPFFFLGVRKKERKRLLLLPERDFSHIFSKTLLQTATAAKLAGWMDGWRIAIAGAERRGGRTQGKALAFLLGTKDCWNLVPTRYNKST